MTSQPSSSSNAALNAGIAAAVAEANFGRMLAEEGITTVALDTSRRMVEYRPDGSTTVLS